jgi:6-phosphogluconolactonase
MLFTISFFLTGCREKTILVTGRFTNTGGEGINIFDFNIANGTLSSFCKADAGPNPSYFCFSQKERLIYAVNEVSQFNNKKGGGITTLKYNDDFTKITKVREITIPNGGPCYISISPDNDFLFIANYAGGSIAVVKLDDEGIPATVSDSIIYKEVNGKVSHAHMILTDPSGRRIYVTDLGLDRIMIYSLNRTSGKLVSFNENGISLPEGTGPRHFVFNNDGSKMYVMGELKSTVTVFDVNNTEGLVLTQTITALSEYYKGPNSSADIHIGKSGEFLYGSNRGENSIVIFKIGKDGLLTEAGHTSCGGDWPRNFVIDPSGKFILVGNQKSGNISVFKIDKKSGIPVSINIQVKLDSPACLRFLK